MIFIPNLKHLFLLFLLFSSSLLYGQELLFNNISRNNALPSKECYHVLQDEKGYIWIATELGLCKLDRDDIQIFDRKNGLPEAAVYVLKNYKGKVWMVTSKNRILFFENNKLQEHPLSSKYQAKLKPFNLTYSVNFSPKLLLSSFFGGTIAIDTVRKTVERTNTAINNEYLFMLNKDGFYPFISHSTNIKTIIKVVINLSGKPEKVLKIPCKDLKNYRFLTCKVNNDYLLCYNDQLIRIKPDLSYEIHQMPSNIICIYEKNGGLWIGLYKKGLFYYPNGNLHEKPLSNLFGYSVSSVIEDSEQNIWCTTLEKGVFMAQSKEVINYKNQLENNSWRALLKTIGNKVCILQSGNLTVIDSSRFFDKKTAIKSKNDLALFEDLTKENHYFLNKTLINDIILTPENTVYAIDYDHISEIGRSNINSFLIKSPGRCLAYLNKHTLLYGCIDGLYSFNLSTKTHKKIVSTTYPITKILIKKAQEILIATKGGGLFLLRNRKLHHISSLPSVIYDIAADSLGNTWLGTNIGLIKYTPNANIIKYNTFNGLPSNDIYKLAITKDDVFFITSDGPSRIPIQNTLISNYKTPLYISTVTISNKHIHFKKNIALSYYQNSLKISFDIVSHKNVNNKIAYKLLPTDTNFRFSQSNEISIENLNPNQYTLIAYGVNSDGVFGLPVQLHFIIKKPFWQQWWFIILCIAVIALTIYIITYNSSQNIQRKETEKTRINKLIAESQLAALQAQMNPHFVFNCINSIQKYILKKEERKAYDYLANFSQLIRMVLHHAQDRNISLHNEIELLNLYVSLEKLRFKDGFEYVTEIDTNLDTHQVLIPPMLLQPYIENAIWHGLMNLDDKKGILLLKIAQVVNNILITIEDNGVGRKQAAAYKVDNLHRPVAVNINQQRINVLNQMYKDSFSIAITDKYDEFGKADGTIVSILLPLSYE